LSRSLDELSEQEAEAALVIVERRRDDRCSTRSLPPRLTTSLRTQRRMPAPLRRSPPIDVAGDIRKLDALQ
jgi:hypothetical protein